MLCNIEVDVSLYLAASVLFARNLNEVYVLHPEPLEALLHTPDGLLPGEVEHVAHLLLVPPHLGGQVVGLARNVPRNGMMS